jgi:hypothetical protein
MLRLYNASIIEILMGVIQIIINDADSPEQCG